MKPTEEVLMQHTTKRQTTPSAYSVYDLTSVEALVQYMHVVSGLPVKYTWIRAIKKGNFDTWPGLTYSNAANYCSHAVETIKVHMVESSQGVLSTKENMPPHRGMKKVTFKVAPEDREEMEDIPPPIKTK